MVPSVTLGLYTSEWLQVTTLVVLLLRTPLLVLIEIMWLMAVIGMEIRVPMCLVMGSA